MAPLRRANQRPVARGVPITPDQAAIVARVFTETGNASEAARAANTSEQSARRVIAKLELARRGELHARALEKAERVARRCLSSVIVALTNDYHEERKTRSLEPKDMAAMANAIAKQSDSIGNLGATLERRLNGRMSRAKTKAEIAAIRAGAGTSGDISLTIEVDPLEVQADQASGRDLPLPE